MPHAAVKPVRKAPQRTCVACRQEQGKRELIRIVRTPEQHISVDPTGKANGRGAYLHPVRSCWEKALKGKSRLKKIGLVEEQNPRWNDLAWNWYD